MENILVFCEYSDTIRQKPQNYCIAVKNNDRWIIDHDMAADHNLILRVTKALFVYENKYSNGLELLSKITPNDDFNLMNKLDEKSKENGWDDFNDVVYNSENRRTILQIIEETLENE